MGGTSREYLIGRLRKAGHHALVAAVEAGRVSAYAAAEDAGFVTRRPVSGGGSQNQARSRAFSLHNVHRDFDNTRPQVETLASTNGAHPTQQMAIGGHGDLPCMVCSHPLAAIARKEISAVYFGSRRPSDTLPVACCRRAMATLTASAMIG